MRIFRLVTVLMFCIVLCAPLAGQDQKKKKLLAVGMSAGWQHESVSDALATLYKLGNESGLWDTYIRTDTELITKKKMTANAKNLDFFDAVFFMTTGELPMDDQQKADLLSFVRDDGKGFLGAHNATDTFYKWPEYGEMIGGYFDGHPWMTFQATVKVLDPSFPGMSQFPASFQIRDEIYQTKEFAPEKVRILMTLDMTKVDTKAKGVKYQEVPIGWVKNYGKGRVYYSGLGHTPEVWQRADIQKMWLEAVKWAMGLTPADATPKK